MTAKGKHASWGNVGSGIHAKLFVKTGTGYNWYDSGTVNINSSNTTKFTFNLSGIANLSDVKEVGVQFLFPVNSSGTTPIYVDSIVTQ